jgi:hypothetical protein
LYIFHAIPCSNGICSVAHLHESMTLVHVHDRTLYLTEAAEDLTEFFIRARNTTNKQGPAQHFYMTSIG